MELQQCGQLIKTLEVTGAYSEPCQTSQIEVFEKTEKTRNTKYKIDNTQSFPYMLKEQTPLSFDEEYVSYDVESLFTNIPFAETIS